MSHRTYDGQRFSPLGRINKDNVKNLRLAYAVPLSGIFRRRLAAHLRLLRAAMRSRQLQNGRLLTFAQLGQEHDLSIRKFERIVMHVGIVHADLAEPGDLRLQISFAQERENRVDLDLLLEGDLGPRKQADRQVGFPPPPRSRG